MAQAGFDMPVLILNNSPFYFDVHAAMGAAVSRAYNRAILSVIKAYPNKFLGIAAAPLQDIPERLSQPNSPLGNWGCIR